MTRRALSRERHGIPDPFQLARAPRFGGLIHEAIVERRRGGRVDLGRRCGLGTGADEPVHRSLAVRSRAGAGGHLSRTRDGRTGRAVAYRPTACRRCNDRAAARRRRGSAGTRGRSGAPAAAETSQQARGHGHPSWRLQPARHVRQHRQPAERAGAEPGRGPAGHVAARTRLCPAAADGWRADIRPAGLCAPAALGLPAAATLWCAAALGLSPLLERHLPK